MLYTGDLCRLDEDGYLYFVSRMDDVIKSRGEKVAPAEVEAALRSSPGVLDAAVIGRPDEVLGQALHAFVVVDNRSQVTAAILRAACRERLDRSWSHKPSKSSTPFPGRRTARSRRPRLSDSSVRTQLQDRAIASRATPALEFIDQCDELGPRSRGSGLASARRGYPEPIAQEGLRRYKMPSVIALKDVLADLRGDPELKNLPDNASVITDVGLDSLELLQFMLEIEANLAIEVDFERLSYDHLESLTDLASFLDSMPRQ